MRTKGHLNQSNKIQITILGLLFSISQSTFAVDTTTKSAKRVIPLTPSLCETIATIAPEAMVGRVDHADFPISIQPLPSVGAYSRPNIEAIIKLQPDLVIATSDGNPMHLVESLEKKGIKVLKLIGSGLLDYPKHLDQIGLALGKSEATLKIKNDFNSKIALLVSKFKTSSPKSVAFLLSENPLLVLTSSSFISEAFELGGLKNAFVNNKISYQRIHPEALVQAHPDIIIFLSMDGSEYGNNFKLSFLKSQKLYTLKDSKLFRLTPNFLGSIEAALDLILTKPSIKNLATPTPKATSHSERLNVSYP